MPEMTPDPASAPPPDPFPSPDTAQEPAPDTAAAAGPGRGPIVPDGPGARGPDARLARALASLRGLAVGDALGAAYSAPGSFPLLARRELPPAPWRWTDDTEMASSVVAVLAEYGRVEQDALAASFAGRQNAGGSRGYGRAVNRILRQVRDGEDWRRLAAALFDGQGSWGNGAAMRVAPLGAWYAEDVQEAVRQAEVSSYVTHQHREAVTGCMAVAAAAALAADRPDGTPGPAGGAPGAAAGAALLDQVIALVPRSAVAQGLRRARDMLDYDDVATVAAVLGNGRRTSAHDTVPFALWSAARHLGDFTGAFWDTAQAGGDVDTTCAIVGGVLAGAAAGAPPAAWVRNVEPLPEWVPAVADF
ncbi:ADP-ribosylglycohydrolase family protein [Streptomyces sp. WMMC500]|uniref:ADP-ribosylglycohydrolase family protein n=1 Tax=Streptomyces sp. WMMC500 TaxID=3015154 RepID=UPI00248AF250|nr:ADP-ribosylglycohydrolase family protein [Streptomyces sp. WMMC500]WBB62645.1 ADP-ribosylglycohydrolase family protein [Streptomyces sp. WMMC500]